MMNYNITLVYLHNYITYVSMYFLTGEEEDLANM